MRVLRRACLGALLAGLCLPACGTEAATTCAGRLTIRSLKLGYCTNRSLNARDSGVRRLVIVVHGTQRNAADYERFMLDAARAAHVRDALVVAPHFVDWSSEGWKQGDGSKTSPPVSSFAALDRLIASVVRSHRFPGLRQVVVAGHSAGGQFVERYAASTRLKVGVPVRYVVANPSSYLYLTPERPVRGTTDRFAVPDAGGCRGYDDYKYGLHALNPYVAAVGAARLKAQFETRHVTYLLGGDDTDPHDSSLDTSCAGELQGAFRLQRGEAFFHYLGHVYGPRVYATQRERIVPGVAHDAAAMFRSPVGRRALFGGG